MRLPIKDKYFKEIKAGSKTVEWRDAHLTFVNESTGEEIRKEITSCNIAHITPDFRRMYPSCFDDDYVVEFHIGDRRINEVKDDKLIG
jgi:hypothetical protein